MMLAMAIEELAKGRHDETIGKYRRGYSLDQYVLCAVCPRNRKMGGYGQLT
jgi:hypothetical protein